jgi:hypothetical protein
MWLFSPYSTVWITCDISRHKFQRHYKPIAPLTAEKYYMQILKIPFCRRNSTQSNVLANRKYQ